MMATACMFGLSKDQIELIDAIAFSFNGLEEGRPAYPQGKAVRRTVLTDRIQYAYDLEAPGIPKFDTTTTISQPRKCVFEIAAAPEAQHVELFDLNQATRFEIQTIQARPGLAAASIVLAGNRVFCENGICKDDYLMPVHGFNQQQSVASQAPLIQRFERAIAFIKKACPGRPY